MTQKYIDQDVTINTTPSRKSHEIPSPTDELFYFGGCHKNEK
jgi:hypothetical protein